MTIGRAPIRPPPGCRFIQGPQDMLIEYPREHAQAVIDWFEAWLPELHTHVQNDLDMAARAAPAQEMVIGPNGQQEQPFSVETPTSPAVPVPRSRMPPVVPRQTQPVNPMLAAGLARQRSSGQHGPVPGQVIPVGSPLPEGLMWSEDGLIVRAPKPMPAPAKAGAIPPVAPQAGVEFPPEQPPPVTRVAPPSPPSPPNPPNPPQAPAAPEG